MGKLLDLMGHKYGRLTAQASLGIFKGSARWVCLCECGNITTVPVAALRSGNTRSCGCLNNEMRASRVRVHGRTNTTECEMWYRVKQRAKLTGVPFNLELADIVIPDKCPLLGIPLYTGSLGGSSNSPSLDRIKPDLGYVKGNIQVISMKANAAKNSLTLDEMERLVQNWRNQTCG